MKPGLPGTPSGGAAGPSVDGGHEGTRADALLVKLMFTNQSLALGSST